MATRYLQHFWKNWGTYGSSSTVYTQQRSPQKAVVGLQSPVAYIAWAIPNESTRARPSASPMQNTMAAARSFGTFIRGFLVVWRSGNAQSCKDSAYAYVHVKKKPVANAGLDIASVKGATIQLNGKATGDSISYFWTPDYALSDDKSLQPTAKPLIDTTYVLHVISNAGCGSHTDSMRVTIYKEVAIPNAFSPNGDNMNDRWNIAGLNSYPQSEIILFDRYGREVFRKRNYQPWDGTRNGNPLPVGVYYYVIDLRDGSPKITGNVYLAR